MSNMYSQEKVVCGQFNTVIRTLAFKKKKIKKIK